MKNLVIISAPSGAGKTTICKALQKRDQSIKFSVSYTTRERRSNEIDGVDYNFISKEDFLDGINCFNCIPSIFLNSSRYRER